MQFSILVTRTCVTLHWLVRTQQQAGVRVSGHWTGVAVLISLRLLTLRDMKSTVGLSAHRLAHHWCNCRPCSPHSRLPMRCMIGLPQGTRGRGSQSTDSVHGKRHQSDADAAAAAAVCEQRTRETCVRARYRTIYGRHDIVRSTNPRSISRYRVIDMITRLLQWTECMHNPAKTNNSYHNDNSHYIVNIYAKILKIQSLKYSTNTTDSPPVELYIINKWCLHAGN